MILFVTFDVQRECLAVLIGIGIFIHSVSKSRCLGASAELAIPHFVLPHRVVGEASKQAFLDRAQILESRTGGNDLARWKSHGGKILGYTIAQVNEELAFDVAILKVLNAGLPFVGQLEGVEVLESRFFYPSGRGSQTKGAAGGC